MSDTPRAWLYNFLFFTNSMFDGILRRYFAKGSFLSQVLTVMSGTALAQVLTVLLAPFLTRLYDPTAYGAMAVFMILIVVPSTVAALRYEQAIMLPDSDNEASFLFTLSVIATIAVSVLCALVLLVMGGWLAEALKVPHLKSWLWLVPTGVFLSSLGNILTQLQVRRQKYGLVSLGRIGQSVTTAVTQLGAGYAGLGSPGLLIGAWLGGGTNALILGARNIRSFSWQGWRQLRELARQYQDFPRYSVPTALMDAASSQLPVLVLATCFTPQAAGLYALMDRVTRLPISLVGSSVSQVFYQRLCHCKNDPLEARRLILVTLKRLFLMGLGPIILITLFGKSLFALVFGPQWAASGEMAATVSVMLLAIFVSSPVSSFYQVYGLQRLGVFFGLATLIYRPLAIYFGFLHGNLLHGLFLLAVLEALQIVLYNIIGLRSVR